MVATDRQHVCSWMDMEYTSLGHSTGLGSVPELVGYRGGRVLTQINVLATVYVI